MKKTLLGLALLTTSLAQSQAIYNQYFDGADTDPANSLIISYSGDSTWQVGPPAKTIFNAPASTPNAILTKLSDPYPVNDTSSFQYALGDFWGGFEVVALQWKQKLDLDPGMDGGILEFRKNSDPCQNAFDNPLTYNFYGFEPSNKDTLSSGEVGFSGTDTTWRDIWFCLDPNVYSFGDTVYFRYTLKSDGVQNNREGWMIDNLQAHTTMIHTVKENDSDQYLKIFPTPTKGVINIQAQKLQQRHVIEHMELMDLMGRTVRTYGLSPTKYFIDISDLPAATYFLKITTNVKTETFPVILEK
jgi:hypothetical protein